MPNLRSVFVPMAVFAALSCAAPMASAKTWRIGFVPKLIGIPYFNAMHEGFEKGAKAFGARITYQGSTTASVSGQVEVTQSLINKHLDAVGVSSNSPTALEAQADAAKKAGVLFYSSDSQVDGPSVSLRVAPANDQEIGFTVVDQLAGQIGGAGDIAIVSGGATATNLNVWIGFMKQRLAAKYPGVHLVSTQYAGEDISKATDLTAQLLSAYPNLKGVIGANSTAVPGAAQAVLRAGLTGKVAVTGITDPNTIRPFVRNGVVKSVVLWSPVDLAYVTTWGIVQLLEHKTIAASNQVPGVTDPVTFDEKTNTMLLGKPLVITSANIDLNF